jgi:hypothetical protein
MYWKQNLRPGGRQGGGPAGLCGGVHGRPPRPLPGWAARHRCRHLGRRPREAAQGDHEPLGRAASGLSDEQIIYACVDAFVSSEVARKLQRQEQIVRFVS